MLYRKLSNQIISYLVYLITFETEHIQAYDTSQEREQEQLLCRVDRLRHTPNHDPESVHQKQCFEYRNI